jgi:hypothetical protein
LIYACDGPGIVLWDQEAYGGSTGNTIVNNTIDESASSAFAILVRACFYNGDFTPAPPGCGVGNSDTSTGNIVFNNVLLGSPGATSVVSSADLLVSSANILTPTPRLFVNPDAGDYRLAPDGGGIGTGVSSYMDASAPAAPGGGFDIGAFSFPP